MNDFNRCKLHVINNDNNRRVYFKKGVLCRNLTVLYH